MKDEHADRIRKIIAEANKGATPPVMALARRVAHLEASEHGLSGRLETCRQDEEQLKSRISQLERELADFKSSQHYRYIGVDGKPVLARDLEDRAIKVEADLAAEKELADGYAEAFWIGPNGGVIMRPSKVKIADAAYRKARGL